MERIFDFVIIIFLFFIATFFIDFEISSLGPISLSLILVIAGCLIFLVLYKKEFFFNILSKSLKFFPENIQEKIKKIFMDILIGFGTISNIKYFLQTTFLTFIVWLLAALLIYILYPSSGINLTFYTAFIVIFVLSVGIAIPGPPGYIGNWQYACIFALSLFSIDKVDALAFSLVYYAIALISVIIIGMLCFPFMGLEYSDLKRILKDNPR